MLSVYHCIVHNYSSPFILLKIYNFILCIIFFLMICPISLVYYPSIKLIYNYLLHLN
ncbi:hypothetical protein NBO_243g0001 [Nosema bombycis CQ1]|uniref:Uncharacterized protein n=1 Tax=Nosema bombycis (strain CQ1 / CVCC 102059) TaxID=578461 RepID=R0MJR3_NOSB1|nr:hypothetical protein NBO_243g0001 [Nosema bombycis CQ1]|eukprot:EOB13028.1 hypothetical protein NBO_243g0001 [Nosema bombycis CQ1]